MASILLELVKDGLYNQVAFIYRWSLGQLWLYIWKNIHSMQKYVLSIHISIIQPAILAINLPILRDFVMVIVRHHYLLNCTSHVLMGSSPFFSLTAICCGIMEYRRRSLRCFHASSSWRLCAICPLWRICCNYTQQRNENCSCSHGDLFLFFFIGPYKKQKPQERRERTVWGIICSYMQYSHPVFNHIPVHACISALINIPMGNHDDGVITYRTQKKTHSGANQAKRSLFIKRKRCKLDPPHTPT